MPTPWQRDLKQDGKKLSEWLGGKLPDAREITVSGLRAPESSGFSNDTLLFDLQYRQDGDSHHEPMVVRIAPTGFQIFPEYDMGLQFHTMERLAATDVPVPKVFWLEEGNPELLGADFYVMGRVEGRVPSDNPPYHKDGWLTEVSPEERRAIWLASYECMAKIHRLDYRALGFDFLDKPELGETPLDQQIAYYKNYLAWAARGLEQPTLEAALEWLEKHKPDDDRKQLSWGDARIGNIIYDGTTPAAVIDWEMVTLGSPEQDVAWEIFLDRHHSEGIETPRLEGFPSYDETLAYYTKHSGFEVNDLHYYQAFAGFRFGVIMVRIAQQLLEYEFMDANTSRGFELNNTVTRLLAKTLELPAPGAGNDGFDA